VLPAIDTKQRCVNCDSQGMIPFYEQANVPAHSCLLMDSPQAARDYPRGQLRLGFCPACGFVSNLDFDIRLNEYSQLYEETQHFSPRFNRFAESLARRIVDQYDLRGRTVLEIGCGKGEFLELLCKFGAKGGIGIDPGYHENRLQSEDAKRITFIRDLYSERYSHLEGDFILCRHTLEHIHETKRFLEMIRRTIGDRSGVVVYFELPDVYRVLRECAFWDIYYEHCTYFSLGSLARLFRSTNFDVTELYADYDDQYLLIAAVPTDRPTQPRFEAENDLGRMRDAVETFYREYPIKVAGWKTELVQQKAEGKKVVVWGSGSKGVAYLTTLGIRDEVEVVVDINPYKHGKFMPGTGQEIVSPEFLREYRPDHVVVMNPIYVDEIRESLLAMGLSPSISACK
jgi:SAM-dependent methyltransferase